MGRLKKWFKRWYYGTTKIVNCSKPNIVAIVPITQYHWTAQMAHWIQAFWLKHWKWIITTGVGVGGLIALV